MMHCLVPAGRTLRFALPGRHIGRIGEASELIGQGLPIIRYSGVGLKGLAEDTYNWLWGIGSLPCKGPWY